MVKVIRKKVIFISPSKKYPGGIYHLTNRTAVEMNKYKEVEIIAFENQYPRFLYPGKKNKTNCSFSEISKKHSILKWYSYPTWKRAFKIINKKANIIYIPYWTIFLAVPILYLAKKSNKHDIKVIIDYHNIFDHDSRRIMQFLSIMCLKRLLKYTDLSIFHATKNYKELKRYTKKDFNSLIIPHGLFDHLPNLKKSEKILEIYNLHKDTKYILMFGIVRKYKGLKYALEAMNLLNKSKHSNYKLLIVGEIWTDLRKEMELIQKYDLDHAVKFIDKFIPDSHIIPFFEISEFIIYPYINATQSGSLQFAFKTKKPVIATKVGNFKEVINNRENGILIPPMDSKKLSEAIIELINDRELVDKISKGGYKYYEENLSWVKIINQIIIEIEKL